MCQQRYNELGVWKPIIYRGDTDPLDAKVRRLSDDPDVQGALFYCMATGYSVVEFAARSTLDLPPGITELNGGINLWKCSPDDLALRSPGEVVYDGWGPLPGTSPREIRECLDTITSTLSKLAFAFGARLTWCLKYTKSHNMERFVPVRNAEIQTLDLLKATTATPKENALLQSSIDWYNHGSNSHDPYVSFLCSYIALESLALAIDEGLVPVNPSLPQQPKSERKNASIVCIHKKYKELFSIDPISFVQQAYFDCVSGVKKRTRRVAEHVFGSRHVYLKQLFGGKPGKSCASQSGKSLSDIRGRLAHGQYEPPDGQDYDVVRANLFNIRLIAGDFISRVLLRLRADQRLPRSSRSFLIGGPTTDPRNIMCASDMRILPQTDWQIKPEWIA